MNKSTIHQIVLQKKNKKIALTILKTLYNNIQTLIQNPPSLPPFLPQMQLKKQPPQQKSSQKSQQKQPQLKCTSCIKSFTKQSDLQIHIKLKHQKIQKQKDIQIKIKSNKVQPRNRVLQMQQNQHQDMIYSYLGELGEKNQQNTTREDLLLNDENQRQNIQTNYSFNKVVRTPYEKQIIPINIIPNQWIEQSTHKQFIKTLVTELTVLYHALDAQKQKWQFRDPMAPEEQAQDQFSLMQIRKLILNYPKRKLTLKYPHFSIFLLWVGRICKPMAWEQFFIIISFYLAEYYSSNLTGKPSEKWQTFNSQFQGNSLKQYAAKKLVICDQKTVKKFVDSFYKWTILFELVNDFC